ncbi:MAG: leucyl/phenylalanyl-tRNA--protein transferase [Bacteroidota bacterium]
MVFLNDRTDFPDVTMASKEGILAVGADLSPERLISAYERGIFPWFEDEEPIIWWSPDPRFVLFPNKLRITKSMKQILNGDKFKISINQDFEQVISNCSIIKRAGQKGTWITRNMKSAYLKLHELGYAKSVEVWQDEHLVGGLYGVDLNNGIFSGESMFTKVSNASKFGFIKFIQDSDYKLIDCQVYTRHLESLGAEDISRTEFLSFL